MSDNTPKKPSGAEYARRRKAREQSEQGAPPPLPARRDSSLSHLWTTEVLIAQLEDVAGDTTLSKAERRRVINETARAIGLLSSKVALEADFARMKADVDKAKEDLKRAKADVEREHQELKAEKARLGMTVKKG